MARPSSAPRAAGDVLERELPGWLGVGLVALWLGGLLLLEARRPLRRRTEAKARRDTRNLAMGAASAVAIRLVEQPLVGQLARRVRSRRLGLLQLVRLPPWAEVVLAVVLLDVTLTLWHVLTHRVPLLWRFHRVHHADLDLTATTALRFHWGEMVLSAPWRAAQVVILGVAPLPLSIWQTLTLLAILFHHADVELSPGLERRLARLVVTPRLHGIHHSIRREERDANWSTILSFPDRLLGTLVVDVPQAALTIGDPELRAPAAVALPALLRLPFGPSRPPPLRLAAGRHDPLRATAAPG